MSSPQKTSPALATDRPESGDIPWPTYESFYKICRQSIALRKADPVPIEWYFFIPSVKGEVCLVDDGENMEIYRNKDEHSSRIQRYWKVDNVYLVLTDNTLHIVSANTPIRKVAPGEIEHSDNNDFDDDLDL